MNPRLLDVLRCPDCGAKLSAPSGASPTAIADGELSCTGCASRYPIVDGIPRFVAREHYANNFGLQWNRYRQTQLDSHSGVPISRDRFFRHSGWLPADLAGRLVLDVGCGAGRFAEVALAAGATVVAVDASAAVDACRQNLKHPRLYVVQADIYRLPLAAGQFDFVYCFGVLQHTPDPPRAFAVLPALLKPGGRLAIDVYAKLRSNALWPKYWLRTITRHISPDRLFPWVQRLVTILWPLSVALGRVPFVGRKLRYAVPVVNYEGVYPLSKAQLREWAFLDTFDMLSPRHDQPQSAESLRRWFADSGLSDIEVFHMGQMIGRGVRAQP
jgi:SAM-dependent methyltransferase